MNACLFSFVLLNLFVVSVGRPSEEPRCSRFEFIEQVLDKIVRMEHANELMFDNIKEFKEQTKRDIESVEAKLQEHEEHEANMKGNVIVVVVVNIELDKAFYAPNFKEVGGTYCFWAVCACVRSFRPSRLAYGQVRSEIGF